mmetsp:Transcript_16990/g.26182  ORF Transcript_16990/g.26182 Transcript_16990/m.26182 type:complete len:222 (+) Transcript_16990:631-1296(+)
MKSAGKGYGNMLSYGPCQFPTLGFIVARDDERSNFKSDNFYSLNLVCKSLKFPNVKAKKKFILSHTGDNFDNEKAAVELANLLKDNAEVKVTKVEKKKTGKSRPLPLNTVKAQQLISRHLKFTSDYAMEYLEKLYNLGLLSYPRTETDIYHPTMDLKKITGRLVGQNTETSAYAEQILKGSMWGGPKPGKNDDKAHPPIHPLRLPKKEDLDEFEKSRGQMG